MKNFAILTAGAIGLALAVSQLASAQTMLEEIVVTARKVSENIQDAPITVNAMTEAQLEDAGVTQTSDYIQFIPNVTLSESQTIGTSFLTVRGLSRVRNGELPVAVVVDDVPDRQRAPVYRPGFRHPADRSCQGSPGRPVWPECLQRRHHHHHQAAQRGAGRPCQTELRDGERNRRGGLIQRTAQ